MRMYDNFTELWLNTENDSLADFLYNNQDDLLYYSEKYDSDAGPEIYAAMQGYLLGDMDISNMEDILKSVYDCPGSLIKDLFTSLAKTEKTEGSLFINNVMHIMHLQRPDMRKEGTVILNDILDNMGYPCFKEEVTIPYEGIVLTGKDEVPKEWEKTIEGILGNKDVSYKICISWTKSHLYFGSDYQYDIPEDLYVEIYADNKHSLKDAVNSLQEISFKYDDVADDRTENKDKDIDIEEAFGIDIDENIMDYVCKEDRYDRI